MTKTPAQRNAAYRTRKAERVARMEAALREIAKLPEENIPHVTAEYAAARTAGRLDAAVIARLTLTQINAKEA